MMAPPLPPQRPAAPAGADPGVSWKLIGRYALCAEIASGGMATVYFGRLLGASGFTRTVAIKRLHPQYAKDPDFSSMFLDEARLAARIRHPNVVQTLDVVQLEGELFLVMDYVPGESLSRLFRQLRTQGRLVPRRVGASILSGALLGLHAAHEAKDEQGHPLGLVHRDVSPQNVLIGTDGIPRLLDFGVAKAAGRAHTTRDGSMKGKCAYMAPEQVTGTLQVSRATDVFAAGVLLWELLTGKRLFQAETDAATLMKVLHEEVPPPSSVVPDLPPAWDAVVARATQRAPADRFATARDMAIAVEACEGVASTTQVGEWVEALAAGTLSSRAQMLERIEKTPLDPHALAAQGFPQADTAPVAISGEHTRVASTVSAAIPPPPGPRKTRFGILAAFAAALVTFGVAWGPSQWRHLRAASTAVPPGQAAPVPPPAATSPPSATADTPATAVEALPIATPSAHAAPPVRTPAPATPRAAAPAPRPATGGTPKPATAPSADCDPPYTLDADGRRHYKRQCLQ
jgi:serine/threonine-protein kinase